MSKSLINYTIVLIVFFLKVEGFAQNAWTKKAGETYLQLSYNTINNYSKLFSNDKNFADYSLQRKVSDNTLQAYSEYGITEKTTIIAAIPLKLVSSGDALVSSPTLSNGNLSGIGNITLGIRQSFYTDKFNIAGQLNVDTKTSSFDAKTGLNTGYDAWSFTPTISVGKGWNKFYLQGFTGVTLRTNDFNHSFKLGGEAGYKIVPSIWLIAFIDINAVLNDGSIVLPASNYLTGLYVNKQAFTAYGLKVIYEINKNFGVNFAFAGASAGNYVAESPSLNFGVYCKL